MQPCRLHPLFCQNSVGRDAFIPPLFIDFRSDFLNAHFGESAFVCMEAFLTEFENMNVIFERIRVNVDEFGVGQGFGKPYRLLLILAVSAVDFSRFRIHRGCNQSVYAVFFANRFKKEFGRSGADNNRSAASVFFFEYRIDFFLLILPELFRHLFAVNKAEKREASALEAVAETEKKQNQIQQKPRRKDYQIGSVRQTVKQKNRFRVNGINRFVKIVKVEFHLSFPFNHETPKSVEKTRFQAYFGLLPSLFNRFLASVKRNGGFLSVNYNREISLAFKAVACELAVLPLNVNDNVALCKKTLDASVFPL